MANQLEHMRSSVLAASTMYTAMLPTYFVLPTRLWKISNIAVVGNSFSAGLKKILG